MRTPVVMKANGDDIPLGEVFLHAFATVKRDTQTLGRLNGFLAQYGFARNLTLSLVLCAVVEWWAGNRLFAAAASIAAIGMFYRYLKFFRQYTVEVLTSYAVPEKGK